MKIGLAGYSGSGVTSVLALLSDDPSLSARHGGPEVRSFKLDDSRLDELVRVFSPKKVTHATLDVVELGDLRPEEGGGLRRDTLSRAAGLDALTVILRGFAAPMSGQVRASGELLKELATINEEFCLTDLVPVENRLGRLSKEGRLSSPEAELLNRIKAHLEDARPLRVMGLAREDLKTVSGTSFISLFPLLVLVNVGEEGAGATCYPELAARCAQDGVGYMEGAIRSELELLDLPDDERGQFRVDLGAAVPAKDRFISEAFRLLDLITFFTVGEKEVRAWTLPAGTTAQRAAGRIHSDIEKGFIRAEVMAWDECVRLGGLTKAKETGRLRVEGKEYVVKDGEIFHVRFNV